MASYGQALTLAIRTTAASTAFDVIADEVIATAGLAAPATLTLPNNPPPGHVCEWFDADGTAGTNAVTISGAQSVNGNAGGVTVGVAFGNARLIYSGTAWGASGNGISAGNLFGTFAARPAPGVPGRVYYTSDGPVKFIDDGTTWHPLLPAPSSLNTFSPPAAATFTEIAAGGSSSLADAQGTLLATMPTATDDIWQSATPLVTPYTIDCVFDLLWGDTGTIPVMGFAMRTAGTGKFHRIAMYMNTQGGPFQSQFQQFTALNTPGAVQSDIKNDGILRTASAVWLRFVNPGGAGNVQFFTSQNGLDFGLQFQQPVATFNGFTTPDRFGLFLGSVGGASPGPVLGRYYSLQIH
jgi:hypothetical protein